MAAVDFTGFASKLKDYALGSNNKILTQILISTLSFMNYMTLLIGNDEIPLTELVVGDILQPGGKDTFDPTANALKVKSRIGKVRACKVDLTFKPTDIQKIWKSYLGVIAKMAAKNTPYDLPFEQFFMDEIVKKAKENLHLKGVFKGVYNAGGTAPQDTMNGLLTLIDAAVTSGEIPAGNVFAGAPITSSNAIDQFRGVKRLVSDAYRDLPLLVIAAPSKIEAYCEDYQATHGALPYNNEFGKRTLDGGNMVLISEPGMAGSNRIIITPESNLFWLADNVARTDSIIIEKEKRNINVMMDFECAPDFGSGALIWTNDQD